MAVPLTSRHRRIAFIALAVVTLVACSHNKPSAKLTYVKVAKIPHSYQIDFESDLNVEALFAQNHNQKVVYRRFVCALENDHDFSVEHTIERTFSGTMDIANNGKPLSNGRFGYTSVGDFNETFNQRTSDELIDLKVLRTLLIAKQTIPCKLFMTVYLSNAYYSETMFIPTADFLSVIPTDTE